MLFLIKTCVCQLVPPCDDLDINKEEAFHWKDLSEGFFYT